MLLVSESAPMGLMPRKQLPLDIVKEMIAKCPAHILKLDVTPWTWHSLKLFVVLAVKNTQFNLQRSGKLQGSDLGPLRVRYSWVAFPVEILTVGAGTAPESFAYLWDPCLPTGLPVHVTVCAWSHYSFLCSVWLMSLGRLLFSEGMRRGNGSGGKGRGRWGKGLEEGMEGAMVGM